jgi:hypothetical protein
MNNPLYFKGKGNSMVVPSEGYDRLFGKGPYNSMGYGEVPTALTL